MTHSSDDGDSDAVDELVDDDPPLSSAAVLCSIELVTQCCQCGFLAVPRSQLPLLSSGKVDRARLRKLLDA